MCTCSMTSGDPDAGSRREGRSGELGGQGQMGQRLDGGGNGSWAASKCHSAQLNCVLQHMANSGTGG